MAKSWVEEEFESVNFGDHRLDVRFREVCKKMYEHPMSSINEACGPWSDTKAAYRLFDNNKVTAEEILASHRDQLLKRIQKQEVVYAIQDTTFFNYDAQRSRDEMGIIESKVRPLRGLLAHNVLIITPEGVPLGVFYQKIYARNPKEIKPKWYERNFEEKESYRWAESVNFLGSHLPKGTHCVVVADREADIFEHLQACQKNDLDFVVRSSHNRVVGQRKRRWEDGSDTYLLEHIKKQKVEEKVQIEIEDERLNKKRTAHLNLRFCRVDFPAPWRMDYSIDGPSAKNKNRQEGSRLHIASFVIEVNEPHVPKGAQAICWRILTSLPVQTSSEALEILDIYKKRWTIEMFHKALKTGCRVEECRLAKKENIIRFLTLCSVVAWRLLWLTKISRDQPDLPCSQAFSSKEWKTIYRFAHKKKDLPKQTPSTYEVVRWLAQMGGFLARKSDGEPGMLTIWRGWHELSSYLRIKTYG